ncbi:MAG: 6-carboxytetrahydropterin synthase QueD [Thiotrichaceae bacterium]|nr:6-carboxytetrahydropterin synthase QueD [Thiotrichaceae bacterium]
MPARYTLKVISDFASAHTLVNYPGACSRMHGHNWKIEAEATASSLDKIGMVIDFKVIKKAVKVVTDRLDHYYLNEIPPFTEINPTAENIARYIYQEVSLLLNNDRIRLSSLTVWETERACVRYEETE